MQAYDAVLRAEDAPLAATLAAGSRRFRGGPGCGPNVCPEPMGYY